MVSASDSGVRSSLGSPCCVIEQDTIYSQKVLVIHRKRWLRPDMTEKLFTVVKQKTKRKRKFRKIIIRHKCIDYDLNAVRQSACLMINPSTVDNFAALFH